MKAMAIVLSGAVGIGAILAGCHHHDREVVVVQPQPAPVVVEPRPQGVIVAPEAPPPVVVERVPPPPGPGYIWVQGYYRYHDHHYVWERGHYVVAPYRSAVWVPDQWVRTPGGWRYAPGHWQ